MSDFESRVFVTPPPRPPSNKKSEENHTTIPIKVPNKTGEHHIPHDFLWWTGRWVSREPLGTWRWLHLRLRLLEDVHIRRRRILARRPQCRGKKRRAETAVELEKGLLMSSREHACVYIYMRCVYRDIYIYIYIYIYMYCCPSVSRLQASLTSSLSSPHLSYEHCTPSVPQRKCFVWLPFRKTICEACICVYVCEYQICTPFKGPNEMGHKQTPTPSSGTPIRPFRLDQRALSQPRTCRSEARSGSPANGLPGDSFGTLILMDEMRSHHLKTMGNVYTGT